MSNGFPSSSREDKSGNRLKRRACLAKLLGATTGISATIGVCGSAGADEAADIRAGKELATQVCSALPRHAVRRAWNSTSRTAGAVLPGNR